MNAMRTFCPGILLVFFILLTVGCGGDGDGGSSRSSVTWWGMTGTSEGRLKGPAGFSTNHAGRLLIADTDNHRIQEFDSSGKFVSLWGEEGSDPGQFFYPCAVAVDSRDNVYVADALNNRIQKFDGDHGFLLQWGTEGYSEGQFIVPFDIAVDDEDNVYVVDMGNSRIQVFSSDGDFIRAWGEEGSTEGRLQYPGGIAISSSGQVYVADTGNDRIQVFSDTGELITDACFGTKGSSSGQLSGPVRIALDGRGNAYVVEMGEKGNNRLQKFSLATGSCLGEWRGEDSAAGQFTNPFDIIVRSTGAFLLDEGASMVYSFDPQIVTPMAEADNLQNNTETTEAAAASQDYRQTAEVTHDNAIWMRDISDALIDKNLSEIVIPGTHDSGTWAITPGSDFAHDGNPNFAQQAIDELNQKLGDFSKLLKPLESKLYNQAVAFQAGWSKTQYQSIGDQLNGGIRYLDFRVSAEPGGFYLVHSMCGDTLQNALNEIRDFCRGENHEKEIILVDINHMYYNNDDGGMTDGQLQEIDAMITQTLIYEDGGSMMVDRTAGGDIPVRQIWAQGGQVIVFVSDSRLCQYPRYWNRNRMRSEWPNTNDLNTLRSFLTAEMPHILDGGFHVTQSIRTEQESDIINGACSWLYDGLPSGLNWIFKKFIKHFNYSVDAPQDILEYASATLSDICGYTGVIGYPYKGPKIQIINNFGDDASFTWSLGDGSTALGYLEYVRMLNILYFGDGGPTISLTQKTTLDETTDGPPSIAQIGTTDKVLLAFAGQDSPRSINTLTSAAGSTAFDNKSVWTDTTSTFPAVGTFGNTEAAVAWTGSGNNLINFKITKDGTTFGSTFTDGNETASSYPLSVGGFDSTLLIAWQGGDGRMNLKQYPGGVNAGGKLTFAQTTKYGTSVCNADGELDVTGVSGSGSFFYLIGDTPDAFNDSEDFPLEWTYDTVSIAHINGRVVLAWVGGVHYINLFIKGDNWYKRTLQETSGSAPSIANVNGMLYLTWRGLDNKVNVAIVNGL